MPLASLSFLFFFLPLSVFLVWCLRGRARLWGILFISFVFVGLLSPVYLIAMIFLVGLDFLVSKPIAYAHPKAKLFLILSIIKDLAAFVIASLMEETRFLLLPLAIAIPAFTSIGYLTDLYHVEIEPCEDIVEYGIFCCFFGKLQVGPIVSAADFIPQLSNPVISAKGITHGLIAYIQGLAKIAVLSVSLLELYRRFKQLVGVSSSVLGSWSMVLTYLLYMYYFLSGYSDMAKGLGDIFGLQLPDNFHHPLQCYSVADFFGEYNISANRFVRKYVYQTLGASDNGPLSSSINILLITILMGLWYGINMNHLMWGAFLGFFIIFEMLVLSKSRQLHSIALRLYSVMAVLVSFGWYCGESLLESATTFKIMFGFGGVPFSTDGTLYLLLSHWLLVLVSLFFCTKLPLAIWDYFRRRMTIPSDLMTLLGHGILLLTALSFLL